MLLDVSSVETEPLMIWVDAVCINQEDAEEKNIQVGMMRSIFSWAFLVSVWHGDSDDSALAAEAVADVSMIFSGALAGMTTSEYIEHVKETPLPTHISGLRFEAMLENLRISNSLNGLPVSEVTSAEEFGKAITTYILPGCQNEIFEKYSEPGNQPRLAGLVKLLSNPWFLRVWVIQEVAVSTNVVIRYGQQNIPWPMLSFTASMFDHDEGLSKMLVSRKSNFHHTLDGLRSALLMQNLSTRLSQNISLPLSTALEWTASFKATDPRDKVYALLAITGDASSPSLSPTTKSQ
jgi:hypothetical protein